MADLTLPDASTVLPTGADPTLNSSANPLTSQYGSAALPASLASAVQPAQTIDPSQLSKTTLTVPQTNNPTNDFVNSLATGQTPGLESTQQLQGNVNNAQGQVDQTTQEIQSLMSQLGYKSQDTANLQSSMNLAGLNQNLTDLNTQYAQKKAQYDLAQQKVAAQPLETGYILGQTGILQAQRAVELGSLAAQIQAAQGNLNTAFNTINQTLNQKYQPILDQLNAKKQFYEINKDKLTQAQSRLATRQQAIIAAQSAQAQNQYKVEQEAATALSNAIKSGFVDATTGFQALTDMVTGAKPLSQISQELGISLNGPTGAGSGATNVANKLGIQDTTLPLSQVVQQTGIDKFVNAIIENEGSSPAGVKNNPGNIKYTGLPGQVDSGVKASDGGTFASYATLQAGRQAIADIVNNAANGKSNAYGVNPTFEDFMNKYTNTAPTQARVPGVTGKPTIDSSAPGYSTTKVPNAGGLTQAAIDQEALNRAMGGTPTISKGTTGIAGIQNRAIDNREAELNQNGNIAANKAVLKGLTTTLSQQQQYAASVTRAYNTANDNLGVIQKLVADNKINNSSVPIINTLNNAVKGGITDAGTIAAFNSAIAGLRSEYAQVLSRGGQVTEGERGKAAQLIPDNISPTQLAQVATQLSLEGQNAIKEANNSVSSVTGQINGIISGVSKPTDSSNPDYQTTPGGIKYRVVK